jgi:hypothetical protein
MGKRRPQPRSHWSSSSRHASDASDASDASNASDPSDATRASTATGPRRAAEGPRPPEEIAAVNRIGVCPVCGTEFDPSSYQVLVTALGRAPFDRIECADVALADRRRAQSELAEQRRRRRRRR